MAIMLCVCPISHGDHESERERSCRRHVPRFHRRRQRHMHAIGLLLCVAIKPGKTSEQILVLNRVQQ